MTGTFDVMGKQIAQLAHAVCDEETGYGTSKEGWKLTGLPRSRMLAARLLDFASAIVDELDGHYSGGEPISSDTDFHEQWRNMVAAAVGADRTGAPGVIPPASVLAGLLIDLEAFAGRARHLTDLVIRAADGNPPDRAGAGSPEPPAGTVVVIDTTDPAQPGGVAWRTGFDTERGWRTTLDTCTHDWRSLHSLGTVTVIGSIPGRVPGEHPTSGGDCE